jgi:predicted RNA-binding Zn-ribbon protein involved in translation (DUF1610 family)
MTDKGRRGKIVKCSSCREKIVLTAEKRPIVISCPKCGKKGKLSK